MSAGRVLVVGAGITGLATAHALAEAGVCVVVLDAHGPAAMASGWTLAGVRQSGRDAAELPLARAAVALWPELEDRLGAPTGYRRTGNLRLALTEAEAGRIRAMVARQSAAGLSLQVVEGADLRALAPALSGDVILASHCADDGQAEPDAVAAAFVEAGRRLGVAYRFGVQVHGVRQAGGRFVGLETSDGPFGGEACLIAAGVGTPALLAGLGHDLPLRRPLVCVAQTEPLAPCLGPVLGTASASMAARQQADGRLRVSSGIVPWDGVIGQDRRGWPRAAPDARTLSAMLDRVGRVLPVFARAPVARVWGGVIDLTPDGLPVLDRVPGTAGLAVAAGFSGHGFCLGPAVAQCMADLLTGRPPRHALDAFRLERFTHATGRQPASPAPLTLHG